jgi:hypothetical protein
MGAGKLDIYPSLALWGRLVGWEHLPLPVLRGHILLARVQTTDVAVTRIERSMTTVISKMIRNRYLNPYKLKQRTRTASRQMMRLGNAKNGRGAECSAHWKTRPKIPTPIVSDPTPHEGMDTEMEPLELISPAKDVQPLPKDAIGREAHTEETAIEHKSMDERTLDEAESQEDMATP